MLHNDSAMITDQAIAPSNRDVRDTAGPQFPAIAHANNIQNIINNTTDMVINETI